MIDNADWPSPLPDFTRPAVDTRIRIGTRTFQILISPVLRDGGDELHRQLAQQDINLTHFDVGTAGQEQRGAAFGNGGSQQRSSHGNNAENPAPDTQHPTPVDETTIALPNGVLVDVLA